MKTNRIPLTRNCRWLGLSTASYECHNRWRVVALLAGCCCFVDILVLAQDICDASQPNILLAIADDWSFGHSGAYGCDWVETPVFDRIAREGLLFTRAYTPNAKCSPSRACLLTGRNSWQLEAAANHICFFPTKYKSYVEVLRDNGYHAGFTGKGWGPGIARDAQGNKRALTGKEFNNRNVDPKLHGISKIDYQANFIDFLSTVPDGKPWCFWLGTLEPHRGYQYQAGLKSGKKTDQIDRVPSFWPDNEVIRHDLLDYAVEVEHFDRHLGQVIETISKRGELDNTLIVVTSDHGMPFPRCKGQAYDWSNHVPLAIRWPLGAKLPGRIVDEYVSFVDLAPTFLEVAGISWQTSGLHASAGNSLMDVFISSNSLKHAQRDHILIGKERHDVGRPNDQGYPIRGIVKDDYLYLYNFESTRWPAGNPETGYLNCDASPTKTIILNMRRKKQNSKYWSLCFGKRSSEELYFLPDDPDCVRNLVTSDSGRQVADALREQLFAELREEGDPRMIGKGETFEQYAYAFEDNRGFFEKFRDGAISTPSWVKASDFEKQPILIKQP